MQQKIEVSKLIVERNYFALICLGLILVLILSLSFILVQKNQLKHNTQTVIVKLSPDGTHAVEFFEDRSMPVYFLNTVNSLISEYTERRYSKISSSIIADYGFVLKFMSKPLQHEFIKEYKAAEIAKKHQSCGQCQQQFVTVRTIQHYEADQVIINAKPDMEYRTTVFITVNYKSNLGKKIFSHRKIITLIWRIKNLNELNANLSALKANPIGLEIIRASIKNDPTN